VEDSHLQQQAAAAAETPAPVTFKQRNQVLYYKQGAIAGMLIMMAAADSFPAPML
jgi:hypothetical protein